MVKLNKSTRLALYSVLELSIDPERTVSAGEIARKYNVSDHHVSKVLQQLVRRGMIRSIRGINGGFKIARDPKAVTLFEIVEIFETYTPENGCLLLDNEESCHLIGACRIGEVFNEIQEQAIYTLKSITVATLISPKKIS